MEDKPADMIMEKSNPDPHSKLIDCLTSVKSVNKTDATTLLNAFGTIEAICQVKLFLSYRVLEIGTAYFFVGISKAVLLFIATIPTITRPQWKN